jgi:hypothetical protein
MNPVTAGKVKYGVCGLICGAIIATIIGFAWGGWTTERTTQRLSQKTSEEAVLAARAAICVAQFMKEPNYQENLQELGKLSSYERSTFIGKGGWDKMPGEETAVYPIARACADGLEVLLKK